MKEADFFARAELDPETGCWLWTGDKIKSGYGLITSRATGKRTRTSAHRVAWEFANEMRVPPGLHVMHLCDNPPCVNPMHLQPGTMSDNMQDCSQKGRTYWQCNPNHPRARGERHGSAMLTEAQVRLIKSDLAAGMRQCDVSRKHAVLDIWVSRIARGRTWSHVHVEGFVPKCRQYRKLSEGNKAEAIRRFEAGESQRKIAEDLGVTQSRISQIWRRRAVVPQS